MGKFTSDATELLSAIGGKENIVAVSHCITRMRYVLGDPAKADIKRIEAIPSVKGTFTQAGQFQVIIGNEVADFYDDFTAVSGVSGVSKAEVKSASKQNQNVLQRLMTSIAEIFAPLIPAIVVGGLILGFRNVIDSMEIFNGATLVSQSQFWAGVDHFLWLLGEAVFHVGIPMGICWTIMKKMGGTEMLGIILGLTLVSGQLTNAYGVAEALANGTINQWDFGFIQVNMIGYQAQVLPAMLAAFTLAYLERFFKKIIPQVVQMILVPFFSLLFAVMAAHFVLGPIGWTIGSWISAAVYAGISGSFRVLFGAVFGFFYAPLVITGLHHMSNAIDLQLIADFGGTMLWLMIALSNIAQGSAVLGMIFLQRKSAKAKELNIPSCISCYLGITEPAMFGINLKYVFPFICGMTGSCIAGILSTASSVTASAIGVGGLPGILSIQPASIGMFAICMLIAIVVPFALTFVVGKRKGIDKEAAEEAAEEARAAMAKEAMEREKAEAIAAHAPVEFKAFLSGKTVAIENVPDATFAEKILGDGVAIEPTSNELLAPVDSVVEQTMDTNHAIGLVMASGLEILLHIGLDTVAMNGDGVGDLNGIRAKLPYLKSLGVDYVWVTPFFRSPMNDNGYDISDYYAVNPMFGTMEDAEAMLREADKLGIGFMFDMVFNHTSTEHEWFQKALSGDPEYMDYYIFRDGVDGHAPTNWQSKFGGSAWEYVPPLGKWYLHLFDVSQADLNWENPRVREELKNVIRFWKGKGVKGFRFDVVNLISKPERFEDDREGDGRRFYTDGRHVHEFLRELVADTGIGDMVTVGEMSSTSLDNCVRYTRPEDKELSMCFSFHHLKVDYRDGDKWALMEPDLKKLRELFQLWQEEMARQGGWNALFWCNHDQPRAVSRFGDDQAYWKESAKMLSTFTHLMRGTPYIYQGEEIGMTNAGFTDIAQYRDVESTNYYEILLDKGLSSRDALHILAQRSRDNGRTPMQWTAGEHAGFSTAEPWLGIPENCRTINVESEEDDPDSILNHYRKLVKLRREYPIIADGSVRFLDTGSDKVIAYERSLDGERLTVVCSFSGGEETIDATLAETLQAGSVLIGNYAERRDVLRPYEAVAVMR